MEKLRERFMYYAGLLAAMKGSGMLAPVGEETLAEDLSHISHLLDAEEDQRLIKLPCKVGDVVYDIQYEYGWEVGEQIVRVVPIKFHHRLLEHIGKSVFLTKAEAEKALAEMKGE